MRMSRYTLFLTLSVLALMVHAEEDSRARDRQQLRAVLSDIETALNTKNFDLAMQRLDDKVIITYHTAEITNGATAARDYYNKMIGSSNAIIKSYSTKAEVSAPATFYGDIAIAHGTTAETYTFADGVDFMLNGRWTAALHKAGSQWKVVALHFSTSITDNPIVNNAARLTRTVGTLAFLFGVLAAVLLTWFVKKRRQ